MSFDDVIGNTKVKKILHRVLKQKKLPNSMLFAGPEGIGKKKTAMVVAKALNCLKKTADACEECTHCRAINKGNFPDVMTISPDKDILKIDQMRLLKDTAYLKPMAGRTKVFVVDDAEKMNEPASNSLLKVLEEPPPFSHIILVTPHSYKILPTLKSRCQIFHFTPIPREMIQEALVDKNVQPERARILSLLVNGNLEKALSLDWEEVRSQRERAWGIFLSLHRKEKAASLLKELSMSRAADKDDLAGTLGILASFCRDIVLIKEKARPEFLMNPDFEEALRDIEPSLSLDQAMDFLSEMDFVITALPRNLNVNILVSAVFSNFLERSHV